MNTIFNSKRDEPTVAFLTNKYKLKQQNMEQEVILTINGKSHKLSKPQYMGGGKHIEVCPKCSLYESHVDFCRKSYYGMVRPLCSILAEANGWDDKFMTYFHEYKIENN